MAKYLLLPVLIFAASPYHLLSAQSSSINFEKGHFTQIKEKALQENKMIFFDAAAPWCGPCKWMEKNVFTNDSVAAFYNAHFISVKFDMEKGEGKDLLKQYRITAYPTYLYLNARGEELYRLAGSCSGREFLDHARNALDPEKQILNLQKKYDEGNRNANFIYSYLKILGKANKDTQKIASEYLQSQNEAAYLSAPGWNILYEFDNDLYGKPLQYLLMHRKEFSERHGADSVEQKLYGTSLGYLKKIIGEKPFNDTGFHQYLRDVRTWNFKNSEKVIYAAQLQYYFMKEDFRNYGLIAAELFSKYFQDDSRALNITAWNFYLKVDDKDLLRKSIEWSETSFALDSSASSLNTQAHLLWKLGERSKAIQIQEEAIERRIKEGENPQFFEDELKMMKRKKYKYH